MPLASEWHSLTYAHTFTHMTQGLVVLSLLPPVTFMVYMRRLFPKAR